MMRFTLPRDMYYGKGALEDLKNLSGKKAIVVSGGSSMRKGGFLDQIEGYLKEAGMEVRFFEGVEPDPSVETVMQRRKGHAGIRARLDRSHRRRLPHRCCQGNVGLLRASGYHLRGSDRSL